MEHEPSEDELNVLMARLSEGERSAFDPLFHALHPRALRLARKCGDESTAQDIAQNALLKVFARASDFEGGRPVLPWFYAIVANELRSSTRGRGKTEMLDVSLETLAAPDDPEHTLLLRELRTALTRAIESLDVSSVEALHAVLGVGPKPELEGAAFRKRVSRAYARLRLLLGASHDD